MGLRGVGIDVVDVRRIERLMAGTAFTQRWFTVEERWCCRAAEHPAREFAALLAAKEAAWKAMGLDWAAGVPWAAMEVAGPGRTRAVELSGAVARAAAVAGVGGVAVTTTSVEEIALAMAYAWYP